MPSQKPVKPVVFLIACLAVVAAMFLGSILIGAIAVESEREQTTPGAMQTDQP